MQKWQEKQITIYKQDGYVISHWFLPQNKGGMWVECINYVVQSISILSA